MDDLNKIEFNGEYFYKILARTIRLHVEVPFDCYLLLKQNNRIVHFVKKNDLPHEQILKKISSSLGRNVYIKYDDVEVYFEYLRQFPTR